MPEKRTRFPFIVNRDDIVVFNELETYECPHCRKLIPVKEEYTDWKELYETQREVTNRMQKFYEDKLEELSEKYPDVKIDLQLEMEEKLANIKRIARMFGNEWGEDAAE